MTKRRLLTCLVVAIAYLGVGHSAWGGTLTCSVSATCTGPSVVVFRLYSTSNSHAELPSQSNYTNLVCCSGVTGLGNACSGTFATVLKLSAVTNAHVEQNSQSNYANSACLSVSSGSVSVGYQASNCTGFDTTVASMSAVTNAHAGDGTAYSTKVCATASAAAQSLTFSTSANSIGFGALDPSAARYATTGSGSSSEVEAHTLTASTNAASGYVITVQGATLTNTSNGAYTIAAIGGTSTASAPGTAQFGLRINVSSGTGTVTSPYAATSQFAYAATAATSSQVASGAGDGSSTVFSLRYLANISSTTVAGSYSANLTYVATGTF